MTGSFCTARSDISAEEAEQDLEALPEPAPARSDRQLRAPLKLEKARRAGDIVLMPAEGRVLRSFFDKPKSTRVAEYYLNPPRQIPVRQDVRATARGKFIYVGEEKFYIRGVTYGPFRPDEQGCEYHDPETVDRDFAQMSASGINAVRTYTVPPRWLLDTAQKHDLRVMVGLPWEQHIAFLDDRKLAKDIERRVREGVKTCAGHAAVLCLPSATKFRPRSCAGTAGVASNRFWNASTKQ